MISKGRIESEIPLPLLITGAAGVAGYNAYQHFQAKYPGQVFATRRVDNWPLRGEGILPCDVDDLPTLKRLFEKHEFKSVLNAEGTCKLKSCELDPTMAARINVLSIGNLLSAMPTDARLVHLSIDLVFGGTRGGDHVEEDQTDPVTIYGKTMVTAEELLQSERPDACILRISLPMGISFNGHAGAIDWIGSRFRKQKPATLYYDEVRTPTYTDCLNGLFENLLASDVRGIFHAGGPRKLSLFEIAQIVNRVGGFDPKHLQGCLRHEAGPIPPRAGDVSMKSEKLASMFGELPLDAWPYCNDFVPTHREWHFERSGFTGSESFLEEVLYQNPRRRGS